MALVSSTMGSLGAAMPGFQLPDVVTGTVCSTPAVGQPVLVMFICAHCPYVIHVEAELARISRDYAEAGLALFAISANDTENYPQDAPDRLRAQAKRLGFACPYLYDEDQQVARAFGAACTPDFFLYDHNHELFYRGQLDASRPGKDRVVDGADLRAALTAVLGKQPAPEPQVPSIGCNVKWKP